MTFDLSGAVQIGGAVAVPAGTYPPITIKKPCSLSLDPNAVLHGVSILADNVSITGGQVVLIPDAKTVSFTSALKATGSKGLRISKTKFVGHPSIWGVPQDADPTADRPGDAIIGLPTGRAITLANTIDTIISDVEISGFFSGINVGDVTNLVILRANIHDLRTTPIHGTINSGLTIDGCSLSRSFPWNAGGKGDHCAAIHIWTERGEPGSVADHIVMINNRIFDNGGHFPVGIETEDNSGGGFTNVLVDHNHVTMGAPQGLIISHWLDGRVAFNTFAWTGGPDVRKATSIRSVDSPSVVITGNTGPDTYHVLSSNPGNTVVPVKAGGGLGLVI